MNLNQNTSPDLVSDKVREIKHSFMVFRNGIISDALRKSGMPYNIFFGLQLPQLSQISAQTIASIAQDKEKEESHRLRYDLASRLWEDRGVRESRLLAAYIFPEDSIDETMAYQLASEVITKEEADILCFRLLRRLPFAESLARRLSGDDSLSLEGKYCGSALLRNLEAMK